VISENNSLSGDIQRDNRVLLAGLLFCYISLFIALLTTLRFFNLSNSKTILVYTVGLASCFIGCVVTWTLHAAGDHTATQAPFLNFVTLPALWSLSHFCFDLYFSRALTYFR
jgi:Co/Zn/Cd efflux system component